LVRWTPAACYHRSRGLMGLRLMIYTSVFKPLSVEA